MKRLGSELRQRPWEVIRPSGYFRRTIPRNRSDTRACLPLCACHAIGRPRGGLFSRDRAAAGIGLSRVCEVDPQRGMRHDDGSGAESIPDLNLERGDWCDVRNPDLYVVSRRSFVAFTRQRQRSLAALRHAGRLHAARDRAGALAVLNNDSSLPYIDMWLAARFHNLFILPQLVVQQIRQFEASSSADFYSKCRVGPQGQRCHGKLAC